MGDRKPYFEDDSLTLHHGDSLTVLSAMPDTSVDCIVTSPPYFGLRDYGVDGQLGAESTPAEYVENMRVLFAEARRVLADDGTLWLNLGDSYSGNPTGRKAGAGGSWNMAGERGRDLTSYRKGMGQAPYGIPPKNLLGIPWRVAFALQDDGWILRNDVIWHKPNPMPMSVKDRLNAAHEHVFLFSKRARYWFDLDPIRDEPRMTAADLAAAARSTTATNRYADGAAPDTRIARSRPITQVMGSFDEVKGRNPGDVWSIPTQPFPGAHFATSPLALPERCILAGCKPGGTVLDPFNGSGTTGMAAAKHGRKYVGIDLNADYLRLSLETRLRQPGLDFGEAS